MTARLTVCTHCFRHVRATDASCPFCDSALASPSTDVMRSMPQRWPSRAAVFAFGAGIAAAGCGDDDTVARDTGVRADTGSIEAGTPPPPPVDMGTPADMSMPPMDMGTEPVDMGTMPPVDLGPMDMGPEDVGVAPPYGVPDPPPPPEEAGVMPLYGAAPPPRE